MTLKYSFKLFPRLSGGWNGKLVPSLMIEDNESYGPFFGAELNNLRLSYLQDQIVPSLEKVLDGSLDEFSFGYEVYDFNCDKQTCKVINYVEENRLEAEIPVKAIYSMLKEWTEFVRKWREQEGLPPD